MRSRSNVLFDVGDVVESKDRIVLRFSTGSGSTAQECLLSRTVRESLRCQEGEPVLNGLHVSSGLSITEAVGAHEGPD